MHSNYANIYTMRRIAHPLETALNSLQPAAPDLGDLALRAAGVIDFVNLTTLRGPDGKERQTFGVVVSRGETVHRAIANYTIQSPGERLSVDYPPGYAPNSQIADRFANLTQLAPRPEPGPASAPAPTPEGN